MTTSPCMVCGSATVPHTSKDWRGEWGMGVVEFSRCTRCGFVKSETHFAMTQEAWEALNAMLHAQYQGTDENAADPRWLERMSAQRDVLGKLWKLGAVPKDRPWLDWGAGDGKLGAMLAPAGVTLLTYDAYMGGPGFVAEDQLRPGAFDLVVSTSVLEHVRSLDTLDDMEALVSEQGVLAIHTLIADEVPRDPSWFYYQAPHVAFFTNEAMRILFRRWGYASCIYHVPSRLWFFFKDGAVDVDGIAAELNRGATMQVAHAERDFVAYWTRDRLRQPMVGHAA